MHEVGAETALAKCPRNLSAVLILEGRRNDLVTLVAGRLADTFNLPNRCIYDCCERFVRHYNAAPKFGVSFAKAADFFDINP
jgi:hypothetical protein